MVHHYMLKCHGKKKKIDCYLQVIIKVTVKAYNL